MIDQIINFATSLIISIIEKTGYLGIFVLMAAESALIPIPSEVTMPFAGFLASQAKFNLWIVIFVGALANLAGSLLAYWLGVWGEEHLIRRLISKYGKYLLISLDEYEKSERWFRKYGEKIVFFSRILPVVRTFISLPAGIAKMNLARFITFTFFGSFIWSALLSYVGFILGKNWQTIEVYYRRFEYLIIILGIAAFFYYLHHHLKKLRRK